MKSKEICIEENNSLEKYFSNNKKYEEFIKDEINNKILDIIRNTPHKIKTVRGYKYKEKTIYEYKIPLDKDLNCRVAYIYIENKILVFFISNTIRKNLFTRLVANLKGVVKV